MTGTDPITAARQRNERWIAGFLMVTGGIFAVVGTTRLLAGQQDLGASILAASIGAIVVYAFAWRQARRRVAGQASLVVRTVLELTMPTAVIWTQASEDPGLALLNAPVILWVVGIFLGVLRLQPLLCLLAGAVAAGEWLLTWAVLTPAALRTEAPLTAMNAGERAVLLLLCGALAWRMGRSLVQLTTQVGEVARERERVRHAFGAYVAEPVVERVLSGDLSLTTERRVISVLFVDIRGFTAFSADKAPTEVLDRLNTALEAFSVEVRERDGIVNKFLGDGLMAIFGAPVDEPDHARNAAMAAVAIARVAETLDRSGAYPGLRIGVGLHCGEVVVGDIGGRGHREYTAIGDVVNTASRVEGVTKELGESVLVTRAVVDALGEGFALGPARRVALRGKAEAIELFALRGGPPTG